MVLASLEACNRTELYQLCIRSGLNVQPNSSRQYLIGVLMGEEAESNLPNAIDTYRVAIMQFVEDHWAVLEPQLTCPAKTRDPKACFGCVDAQVMTCIVQNPDNEHLIQLHRTRR